jgi:hypothetical protein
MNMAVPPSNKEMKPEKQTKTKVKQKTDAKKAKKQRQHGER